MSSRTRLCRPGLRRPRRPGYSVPGTGDPEGTIPIAWYFGTAQSDLHTCLAQDLDILVMSPPLTPATTRLRSAPKFATLDLTDPEPRPEDDPLWDAKNVIIMPHIAGWLCGVEREGI
jgi:phosphoglycerate dehydrogenase-like enzyme